MSRNDVILGLFALVLVGFSLIVALVVPRRYPDFPGGGLRAFVALAVLLVAGMLTAVEIFGAEHEEEPPGEAQPAAPNETETGPGTTTTGETATTAPAEPSGDPAAGEQVFASAGCGSCHTLEAAGTTGTVGPNLDESQPDFDLVVERVTNGMGVMPSFADQLSEAQIRDVGAYVVASTQG